MNWSICVWVLWLFEIHCSKIYKFVGDLITFRRFSPGCGPQGPAAHWQPQNLGTLGYFLRSSASFSGLMGSPLRRPHRGQTSPITPT